MTDVFAVFQNVMVQLGLATVFRSGSRLALRARQTMRPATGNKNGKGAPRLLLAAASSHDDSGSSNVAPVVTSSSNDPNPATPPTVHLPSDPTRSATPTSSPELQPAFAATPLRSPDRYQILGEHGRGGIGRVSRAHDRELGRDVAIKELISRGQLSEARFLREALITARLEHPGIVPVHEAGRWPDGTPFYAMKLVAGRPLRDLIAERTTVDQRIGLLHHVIAVADAIAYAQGRNIIHRDLKPANVIVGDFGETVVIDWGLAKDLSATEEPTVGGGSFLAAQDAALTSMGAVLGTPTYMAPEQERGEPVDQRADVFAIGAMLWELCSLDKVPPTNLRQRHRILRRAGIERDLAIIIDKALDPEPGRRYPDAGALAADLKAFKSGARIAARRYSAWGVLAHWTRRNRTLAVASAVLIAVAIFATLLYIRNVSEERDRADAALARSEASKNAITLEHAQLLLQNDPTTALAALSSYRGAASTRARQIAAEAHSRGAARAVLNAHSAVIHFLAGLPDGSLLSLAEDRRILLTKNDVVARLADDLAIPNLAAYSEARQLLVYSSTTPGAVLLEIGPRRTTRLSSVPVLAIAFTEDGSHLAILDDRSEITIWSISTPLRIVWHRRFLATGPILFSDKDRLVVPTQDGFATISRSGDAEFHVAVSAEVFAVSSERLAIGDITGLVSIFKLPSFEREGSLAACRERVREVKIIPTRHAVVFACQEGSAGVASYFPSLTLRERFDTQGPALDIASSGNGRLAVILSESTIAYIHDLDTGLTSHYEGQGRLSYAAAPSSTYPLLLTGDINGTIRSWAAPASDARVLFQYDKGIHRTAISPSGKIVAAGADDGTVTLVRVDEHTADTRRAHTAKVEGVRFMPNGMLVTYGFDGRAIAWRSGDFSIVRSFDDHHSRVEDVDFVARDSHILSVGDDGRLLEWSPYGGEVTTLFATSLPLMNLEVLAANDTAVVADSGGSVWHIRGPGDALRVRSPDGDLVTLLRASATGRFVVIGTADGHVSIIDSDSWRQIGALEMNGPLRQAVFSHNDMLALASERRDLRILFLRPSISIRLYDTSIDARDISFSPDGQVLAIVCADGRTWFHQLADDGWIYVRDHYALTSFGRFSTDGALFVSSDATGLVVLRDVLKTLSRNR